MKFKTTWLILLILSFSFMVMGCPMFQKAKTDPLVSVTTSYQILGESITSTHKLATELRAVKKIDDIQMVKYNELLFKVQSAYSVLGSTLVMVIVTTDSVKQKEYRIAFEQLSGKISGLITEMNLFIIEVKK